MATTASPKRRRAKRPAAQKAGGKGMPSANFADLQAQMLPATDGNGTGSLIVIGGQEDKQGDKVILRELCSRVRGGKLVVATIATAHPEDVWQEYRGLFRSLGVSALEHLHISSRADAFSDEMLTVL